MVSLRFQAIKDDIQNLTSSKIDHIKFALMYYLLFSLKSKRFLYLCLLYLLLMKTLWFPFWFRSKKVSLLACLKQLLRLVILSFRVWGSRYLVVVNQLLPLMNHIGLFWHVPTLRVLILAYVLATSHAKFDMLLIIICHSFYTFSSVILSCFIMCIYFF